MMYKVSRSLHAVAWVVALAVFLTAQCSASCLATLCNAQTNGKHDHCHPSPAKKQSECPLNHYQLSKVEHPESVGIYSVVLGVSALAMMADLTSQSPRARAGLELQRSACSGPPLLLLLSTLRL